MISQKSKHGKTLAMVSYFALTAHWMRLKQCLTAHAGMVLMIVSIVSIVRVYPYCIALPVALLYHLVAQFNLAVS